MDTPDTLALVKGYYEYALGSSAYQHWRREARQAWDFYDGTQWSADDMAALADVGQPAIVINKIAPKIDNLAGTEVAGRTRITFRSRSGDSGEERTAQALSDLAQFVAERANQPQEVSRVFRAGLVCGLGWLDVGVQDGGAGEEIFCRCEDEMQVVFDPMAQRSDFSDARFVARERWLDAGRVREIFPDMADTILALGETTAGLPSHGLGGWGEAAVAYFDPRRQLYRVVEVQHRVMAKQWRVRLPDGRLQHSFDRAVAKQRGAVVEQVALVPRVMVAYFAGDILLDHRPLGYDHNRFTLIPYVYKRHRADGRPYGLVRSALDPQRELNKRRSKAMHLLNTAQVIADIDAVEDPAVLAREAARPDGMILKRAGKDLRIVRNTDLAASQVAVMEQAGRDIQDVMGVFDENLGKESNAVSGAAIQQRQLAGSLNQMFAFDALRALKKHLGEHLLALMRQTFTHEMVLRITDHLGASRVVRLNAPLIGPDGTPQTDAQGDVIRVPDLTAGIYDVVVEEVRDDALSRRDVATLNALRPDLMVG